MKRKPMVFIKNKRDAKLEVEYRKYSKLVFLDRLLEVRKLSDLWQGFVFSFLVALINSKKKPIVFFWYVDYVKKMIPSLKRHVRVYDFVHNLRPLVPGDEEYLNIDISERIDCRILINAHLADILTNLYKVRAKPRILGERIHIVNNGVFIPGEKPVKDIIGKKMQVLFAGRPVDEKRVHIAGKIAAAVQKTNADIEFVFAGDLENSVLPECRSACIFKGEVTKLEMMQELFASANILLLTSISEGFPMVIAEAMAFGVVPIVTDIGGISHHIKDDLNGFLITPEPENECIIQMTNKILELHSDRRKLEAMSVSAYLFACSTFSEKRFCKEINELFS
jgi:glycosyltransferase involved in cell wall biosynthesis